MDDNTKTDNEINQLIHEKILGECWHEIPRTMSGFGFTCHCGEHLDIDYKHPDYCNSLDAMALVEAKVIESGGMNQWSKWVYFVATNHVFGFRVLPLEKQLGYVLRLDARQRAEACLRAVGLWEDK